VWIRDDFFRIRFLLSGSLKNRIRIIFSRSYRIRIGMRIRSRPKRFGSGTLVLSRDILRGWGLRETPSVPERVTQSWPNGSRFSQRVPLKGFRFRAGVEGFLGLSVP
jgi:hypothetical protein